MRENLYKIFEFLKQNQNYNANIRVIEYQKSMIGCTNIEDKVRSICVFVFNTQPFPKLDKLLNFMNSFKKLDSMEVFINQLINNTPRLKQTEVCNINGKAVRVDYNILFKVLLNQKGWGEKTAALFSKIIYVIHKTACATACEKPNFSFFFFKLSLAS